MLELQGTVTVDLSSLGRFEKVVDNGLRNGSGPFKAMYKQWGARYRSFIQERFDKYSRGGGDWPPLSPRTRRKRGDTARATLLRDTGTMFAATMPVFSGLPGQLEEQIEYGIRVGFGGAAPHPSTRGKLTVAELAEIHDQGIGKMPQRQIIVPPSAQLLAQMAGDAERAVLKAAQV